jgi:hypothetical protein
VKIGVGVSFLPTTTRIERATRALVPHLEPIFRNVDDDVAVAEVARQPAPALEIQLDLLYARLGRNVQLRDAGRTDNAVRLETMPSAGTASRHPCRSAP